MYSTAFLFRIAKATSVAAIGLMALMVAIGNIIIVMEIAMAFCCLKGGWLLFRNLRKDAHSFHAAKNWGIAGIHPVSHCYTYRSATIPDLKIVESTSLTGAEFRHRRGLYRTILPLDSLPD